MAALMPQGKQQYFTAGGIPLVGGKVYTYAAGTTTPLATYTTSAGTPGTENTNPVILDSRGEASIFFSAANYKIVVKDSLDSTIWTQDNLPGDQAATILANLAASTGSSLVGHSPSGTGASATNVSAYLNLTVRGLKRNYGCAGDGTTNDYAKLANALQDTGKLIEIEDGTYLYNTALPAPTCAGIIGHSEIVSILKPGAAVTKGLSIGATNYPTRLSNFKIDGSLTTNATGLYLGDASSIACLAESIRCSGFAGATAYGFRIGDLLKSKLTKLTAETCGNGYLVQRTTAAFPTTVHLDSCVASSCTNYGEYVVDGFNILHTNCVFESSGLEGVYVLPRSGGTAVEIGYEGCWFEANNGNANTKYHMVSGDGTAIGGATIRAWVKSSFFDTNAAGTRAKAIRLNGSANAGFTLSNVALGGTYAGAITVENGAYGEIPAWLQYLSYATCVSDASNLVKGFTASQAIVDAAWTAYTPTYSSNIGDAAATFSGGTVTTNLARYKVIGKQMFIAIRFTATLNAVTPAYIQVSMPGGYLAKTNQMYTPATMKNTTTETGALSTDGASGLIFYRAAYAAFSSAAAVGGAVSAVIEIQ